MTGVLTSKSDVTSARAQRALAWGDAMAAIVNGTTDAGWDSLVPMIDPARFVRRGNERTEMDWPTYRGMLEGWGAHSGKYEKILHGVSEVGNFVYLDLDEHATDKAGQTQSLRSISIYEFDDADRIVSVDVIMGLHGMG
jgi:hypothetical protein